MIEIFETLNPKIFPYIIDKLPELKRLDVNQAIEVLLLQIASNPDNSNIIVAFEDQELKAFIFGYINSVEKYGWVRYGWADVNFPKEYKQEVMAKFEDWVKEKGFDKIKAETARTKMKAWKKLYGFEEDSVILTKKI